MANVTSARACSRRGIHLSLIARSRCRVASVSASMTFSASAAARVPDSGGERGAVRLPRSCQRRAIPGRRRRDDTCRARGVADPHGRGVGDRHLREQAVVSQSDRTLAAEQRSPQQPGFRLGLAVPPLCRGLRCGFPCLVQLGLEDAQLAVEQTRRPRRAVSRRRCSQSRPARPSGTTAMLIPRLPGWMGPMVSWEAGPSSAAGASG